jgi:hypothetical protein
MSVDDILSNQEQAVNNGDGGQIPVADRYTSREAGRAALGAETGAQI